MARSVARPVPAALAALVVLGTLVTGLSAVAAAPPAGAVAHGEVVPEGQYRFAARLALADVPGPFGFRYSTVCSGALVAPSWVVTAGHCFVDPFGTPVGGAVAYPVTVTVGSVSTNSTRRQALRVTEVRQAPGTDLALARLSRPVPGVTPLALATEAPAVGDTLRLTGWGATNALLPLPSNRLRTGLVTVSSVGPATVGVRGLSPARDTSACLYDSGAPYFSEGPDGPRLVGVESDGPPCPHAQEETTARVDTVVPWIRGVLATR